MKTNTNTTYALIQHRLIA